VLSATTGDGVIQRRLPASWERCPRGALGMVDPLTLGPPGRPLYVLDSPGHVQPPDAAVVWKTPANLRVVAAVAWDAAGFHFLADVYDDVFHQPYSMSQTWKGDSIQLAFDAANDALEGRIGYDANDHEFALALTPDGAQVFRHAGPPGLESGQRVSRARLDVRRQDDCTRYHCTIPWPELVPLNPVPGRMFGFTFIVNDNDGAERAYWLGLSPGIGEMKYPYAYRRFVFAP